MTLVAKLKDTKARRHKAIEDNDMRIKEERAKEEKMKKDWRFKAEVIIEELPKNLRLAAKEKDTYSVLTLERSEYGNKKAFDEKSKYKDLDPKKLTGCARKVFMYCKKQGLNPKIAQVWDSAGPHDFVCGYEIVVSW